MERFNKEVGFVIYINRNIIIDCFYIFINVFYIEIKPILLYLF
jgi:hypothetical protein